MKYVSTLADESSGREVEFEYAVLNPFAADGGLWVPSEIPTISKDTLRSWQGLSYQKIAYNVLSLYISPDELSGEELTALIETSLADFFHPDIAPTVRVGDRYVLELFHGHTLAFKDYAMRLTVNMVAHFVRRRKQKAEASSADSRSKVNVVVATSGDTGPSAASAAKLNSDVMNFWCLYPVGKVSRAQELQMTTMNADNVHILAIEGLDSDGLDKVIEEMMADKNFVQDMQLLSVNSVNICRVVAQSIHFIYSYLQIVPACDKEVVFSIPCGACGNQFGGYLARSMGLPVKEFILTNNENASIVSLFESGKMRKRDTLATYSNAIDIQVPYNIFRYLYFTGADSTTLRDWMDTLTNGKGEFELNSEQLKRVQEGYRSVAISESETIATMEKFYNNEAQPSYLLDPHTAVAMAGSLRYYPQHPTKYIEELPIIVVSTAHPSKFQDVCEKVTGPGSTDLLHHSLQTMMYQREYYYKVKGHAEALALLKRNMPLCS
ncbi:threonine synthase [Sphaeroforma arctica JP610]|uniref:Threonine synthase n=1 Tax=Sphaeroforma arctica JP610 TaxID=667725 RepID=A0A0L0GC96_9EUKA|nr:threonine synthase [Sphaeroforma arctica JP610]KNC86617.1 threonine synthase [Sphaeroforma arctica JP610]|eukprot:XP_014160519.1 threonine synthase [Sphaeroforma arctica JP610]